MTGIAPRASAASRARARGSIGEALALALSMLLLLEALALPQTLGLPSLALLPVGLALGGMLGRWRIVPLRVATALLALVVAALVFTPITWLLARPMVRDDRVDAARADAIVVFSGAVTRDGLLAGEAIDRLLHALQLRRAAPALPLLLSSYALPEREARSSARDQRALVALAGGAAPIFVTDVRSTHDEAVLWADTLRAHGWRRVIAVTSPQHTRRACATLARRGLVVQCSAAPWRLASLPPRSARERLLVARRLLYEALAWTQYAALGWATWRGD